MLKHISAGNLIDIRHLPFREFGLRLWALGVTLRASITGLRWGCWSPIACPWGLQPSNRVSLGWISVTAVCAHQIGCSYVASSERYWIKSIFIIYMHVQCINYFLIYHYPNYHFWECCMTLTMAEIITHTISVHF